jgi:hypothetical protein
MAEAVAVAAGAAEAETVGVMVAVGVADEAADAATGKNQHIFEYETGLGLIVAPVLFSAE